MKSSKQPNLVYDELIRVTRVYLGPAAERFINRQVENHLHKSPSELTRADLKSLIDWIRAVVALLTDNHEIIEEYIAELQKLTRPKKRGPKPKVG